MPPLPPCGQGWSARTPRPRSMRPYIRRGYAALSPPGRLPGACRMERVQFDGSRTFSAGQFRLVRVREGGINGVPEVESPAPQVPCLFCWHENEPVSYTHLRAHETKANLVCRLLLEK